MEQPMRTVTVGLKWLENGAGLDFPRTHSEGAAGLDLCAALPSGRPIVLHPGKRFAVPVGFAIALPRGFEAQIRPRSGLAVHHGVTVLNSPGTIDSDYRGEIHVLLINLGDGDFAVKRGDRIAQMVVAPVCTVGFDVTETLDCTSRGAGGFGSTGQD
ncbi:MAG TPA: dUTP diphosphatase [Devosia sp.]|nr:dUTP diphosphatase [Devosia sp.]